MWAVSTSVASNVSAFNAVATDNAGNVYAVGTQGGANPVVYGSLPTTSGCYNAGNNSVIVKFSSGGTPLWAVTPTCSTANVSVFAAVATDNAGNVYAVGYQTGSTNFIYAPQTVAGGYGSGTNSLIVKFDSNGNGVWAASTSAGAAGNSLFNGVATDNAGNVYAVGSQSGSGFTYSGQSPTGAYAGGNAVIVKYNTSTGAATWAASTSAGANVSDFLGVTTDSAGNAYAVGYQTDSGIYTYSGQSATGSSSASNSVIVKYSGGIATWAASTSGTTNLSQFNAVATDSAGNVYAVGYQYGSSPFTYTPQSATASYAGGNNSVIVKYNSGSGTASWAVATSAGLNISQFNGVAIDGAGNVYAVGSQATGTYTYSGQNVTGSYAGGNNCAVVQYNNGGTALAAASTDSGLNTTRFAGVATDSTGNTIAVGTQFGNSPYTYSGQSVMGNYAGNNVVIVKY